MNKFYQKNELYFAIMWIIIYVVLMGNLRNNFGDESLYSMLGILIIALILTAFIVKNKLTEKYGLIHWGESKKYLYFIPFIMLCSVNLWFGITLQYNIGQQIIAMATLGLAAYVEEIIFRGLLFKAIEKDSIRQAIIISAITFGAGHIVNLLTGQGSLDTLFQMGYAIAIGFAFAMFFFKSGSIIPCIATHAFINMSSKLANHNISTQAEAFWGYASCIFIILIAGGYALYLRKINKKS